LTILAEERADLAIPVSGEMDIAEAVELIKNSGII